MQHTILRRSLPWILLTAVGTLGLAVATAGAVEPVNKTFLGSLAVKGYDTVAYFTDGKPVKGQKSISHEWQGAVWRFASAENRDRFAADPEKYAPQYGGYCAWAVSQGSTAGIDPAAFEIVDGKLYLNYNAKIQKRWQQDIPKYIRDADANWPKLLDED